jgi:hypothetical protein
MFTLVRIGAFGAFALGAAAMYLLMRQRRPPPMLPVRDAGPDAMTNPPKEWDAVDEMVDESFPASDPPGTY